MIVTDRMRASRWNRDRRKPLLPEKLCPLEGQVEDTILAAARLHGWRRHAERPAKRQSGATSTPIKGDAGWPDLTLVKRGHFLVRELKRYPRWVEDSQCDWMDELAAAGVDVDTWWCDDKDDIVTWLGLDPAKRMQHRLGLDLDRQFPRAPRPPDPFADFPELLNATVVMWFCPETDHKMVTWTTDPATGEMYATCDHCGRNNRAPARP